jgi:hypothetical protein
MKRRQSKERPSNLEEINENYQNFIKLTKQNDLKQQVFNETASLMDDAQMHEEKLHSIVELEHDDTLRVFQL